MDGKQLQEKLCQMIERDNFTNKTEIRLYDSEILRKLRSLSEEELKNIINTKD